MRVASTTRQPRQKARTFCDQCDRDWAFDPAKCVTVTIPWHHLCGETVCLECVNVLGITGCAYRDGEPVEYVWGTAPRPKGWKGHRMSAEEILRTVSSANYKLPPRPREMARLDIPGLLGELWRPEAEAGQAGEAA